MEASTKIRIDESLFIDLCIYAIQNADNDSPRYRRIEDGIQEKLDAVARHRLYSKYKTGATEEERRQARQEYLEKIGIPASFQWDPGQDHNAAKRPFELN